MAEKTEPAVGVIVEGGPGRAAAEQRKRVPGAPLLRLDVKLHCHVVLKAGIGADNNHMIVTVDAGGDGANSSLDDAGRAPTRPRGRTGGCLPGMENIVVRTDSKQIDGAGVIHGWRQGTDQECASAPVVHPAQSLGCRARATFCSFRNT